MHPTIMMMIANDRIEQLKRDAAGQSAGQGPEEPARREEPAVELRLCRVSDDAALEQLAALAERELPRGRLVLAEVDGRVVAALPLAGGAPLTDPFAQTEKLLPLLRLRAEQIRGASGRRARLALRVLPHRA